MLHNARKALLSFERWREKSINSAQNKDYIDKFKVINEIMPVLGSPKTLDFSREHNTF